MPLSAPSATYRPEPALDVPRLLQQFESLGENCDLGVVQRAVGLEPFGLFRFASCEARGVLQLLRARFEPLCEPQDLIVEEVGPRREYWLKSRTFPFESHTNRYAPQDEAAVVRAGEIEKMRYLKSHLLNELARGRKLFVYKGRGELPVLRELAAELRAQGPNSLLWVDVAAPPYAAGSVERDSQALLRGWVSRFGTYEDDPSLPVEEWVAVCARAYRLWRGSEPPLAPVENLITRADVTGRCEWSAEPPALTRRIGDVTGPGGGTFEHRVGPESRAVWQVQLPLEGGGKFVFSAWVRIPEGTRSPQVSLVLAGFATTGSWHVDPAARERWQRAWVAATLPQDARVIACELRARAESGDLILSSGWCLERATRPSGHGFIP